MAAFQYHGYALIVDNPAERLRLLGLHIVEVSEMLNTPNLSGDGKSVDYQGLREMLRDLKDEQAKLMQTVGSAVNGGVSTAFNTDIRGGGGRCRY